MKKKKTKKRRDKSRRKFDSEKLQKRMKKSQERAQGGMRSVVKSDAEVTFFNPKDDSHVIDIIPYNAGKHDPIVEKGEPTYTLEVWVHTGVGPNNAVFLCPSKMYDKDCPICEDRQKLRDKGKDKEVWKPLFPKCRHLYNVVSYDRGEEKKGIQVFDISYHYSEKHLIPLSKQRTRGGKERTINFASPTKGKNINFTIEPPKSKDDYPSYVGWSFVSRDYEIEDEILDAAHTLDEIIHIPEYDEIASLYFGNKSKSKKKASSKDDSDSDDDNELEELLEELEDLDEMEELEEFIDENNLKIKIKKKDDEDDVKEKITEALEKEFADDKSFEEEDEDEEEEEEEEEYSKKQIRKMKKKKLKKLIDDEELDIDPDDADDLEELQDMVIEELDL